MDFTYLVALVLSLAVGFVGSLLFVAVHGRSFRRLIAVTLAVSIIADFALLIDWSRSDEITAAFLLTDAAFFIVYGSVGCALGALPVLAIRRVYRAAAASDLRANS